MLMLLYGSNQFDSLTKLQQLCQDYKGNITTIDGEFIEDVAQIFADTDTVSMFASKQLTIVKRFQNNRRKITLERALVTKLQSKLTVEQLDLIFWEDSGLRGKSDKGSKKASTKVTVKTKAKNSEVSLTKFIKDNGEVLNFPAITEGRLPLWLNEKLKVAGISNGSTYSMRIIDRCGSNQFILASEIEKLATKLRAEKRSNLQDNDLDILTLYEHTSMVWDLTDAICNRDKQRSLYLIEKMLRSQDDAPMIFASILKQFKYLYVVKKFGDQGERIKKIFDIKPYPYSKLSRYAYSFTEKQLQTLFNKLVNLDFSTKQGKIDIKLGLDLLIAVL